RQTGERHLGVDPASGRNLYARMGRYGAYVQIGENTDEDKKYANIRAGLSLETIDLAQALDCFRLPRIVGEYEGLPLKVAIGRFGPYVQLGSLFASLAKEDDPYSIDAARAIELVHIKREKDAARIIKAFADNDEVKIVRGRWGPFLAIGKNNYRLPKGTDPLTMTLDDCLQLASQDAPSGKTASAGKSATAATSVAKKSATKKTVAKTAATKKSAVKKSATKKTAAKKSAVRKKSAAKATKPSSKKD
ncbi:MAG: topoisomerase C-terminal repeat-containing protein, partial [Candidatus Kapaibacterium sp.]